MRSLMNRAQDQRLSTRKMSVHLSGRDVDDALLRMYGRKKEGEPEPRAPRKCVRCGVLNPAEGELCSKCGMALTLQAVMS